MVILFIHLATLSCWVFRLFLITYINNAELNKLTQIFVQIPDCLIRETLKSGNSGSNSSTFLKVFFLISNTIPETLFPCTYPPTIYICVFPVDLLLTFCLVFTGALLSFFFTWKSSLHIRHMTPYYNVTDMSSCTAYLFILFMCSISCPQCCNDFPLRFFYYFCA